MLYMALCEYELDNPPPQSPDSKLSKGGHARGIGEGRFNHDIHEMGMVTRDFTEQLAFKGAS